MIDRYQSPEIARIFSPSVKYRWWFVISLTILRLELGVNPCHPDFDHFDLMVRKIMNEDSTEAAVLAAEEVTNHDVMAFLGIFEELVHKHGNPEWVKSIHKRTTSSDIVDTAMAAITHHAAEFLNAQLSALTDWYGMVANKDHRMVAARTHGQIALPAPAAERWIRFSRDIRDWGECRSLPGKIGGPTGLEFTDDEISTVSRLLELSLVPRGLNQCVSRHLYAEFMGRLKNLSGVLESHATIIRLHMIEGVSEYQIHRSPDHVGSSSMPHKNNPVELEKVCGMSRLVRGYELAMSESTNLWHERDMSHSCVERVAIEDTFHCITTQISALIQFVGKLEPVPNDAMLDRATRAIEIRSEALSDISDGSSRASAWKATKV